MKSHDVRNLVEILVSVFLDVKICKCMKLYQSNIEMSRVLFLRELLTISKIRISLILSELSKVMIAKGLKYTKILNY